jgi:histone acetyltransferase (RNA polymerase elongator complex component)
MTNYYIIPIFVPHKGCPHDCIFCNQKKITGSEKEITQLDVQRIINTHLNTINKENSFIEVSFFGGSFTGISMQYQSALLEVAKGAKDKGDIAGIRLSTRPDYIDEKILDNLKKFNVDVIELGVQSMNINVLKASERGHSPQDVVNASKLIKDYGFKLGLQMMIGLPEDNIDKDIMTANEIIKLNPDFVRIYPSLVIKETKLEELFVKGTYKPLSIDEAINICKKLYREFSINDIPIIRLGLQTTEQISLEGDVVGGPFHPAFRELVEAALLNEMVQYMISNFYSKASNIKIQIAPKDISKLFADKKRFFNDVLNTYNSKNIAVRQNTSLIRGELSLSDGNLDKKMSLYEYLKLEN